MTIITFIKSLFTEHTVIAGERVNHVRRGAIQKTDGYVVAKTLGGILVEWPRGGASVVPVAELCVIG